ncbi:hypothetical protein DFH06DRAFT_983356 [Mycena polygramma]|nr:hypothetical protein DFH06DRAFT_983356 [Mycena polygramma]
MASVEVVGGLASPSSHNQPPRLGFTNYRTPPRAVPKASVLVQVWAVGLDAVDLRLLGVHTPVRTGPDLTRSRTQSFGRFMGRTISRRSTSDGASITDKEPTQPAPHVGFIPGRSFVGRVLECGWEVRDEVVRRGEWVVGLLDIRKSGALAEFITVDRHRIVRVPHPHMVPSSPPSPTSPQKRMRSAPPVPPPPPTLDLAELALLPLAGVAALRAVRTLAGAYQGTGNDAGRWKEAVTPEGDIADPFNTPGPRRPASIKSTSGAGGAGGRRALVLHGHAGTGGLVARILVRRGWRVCVHAPGSLAPLSEHDNDPDDAEEEERDREHMRSVQARARAWGGDGGRGAAVRAIERLIGDGDEFDAVIDCVGGREVWEAGERLLARGDAANGRGKRKQFTTTVGDCPARPVPTAKDNFRAGLRALKGASASVSAPKEKEKEEKAKKSRFRSKSKSSSSGKNGGGGGHVVSYAWVSAAQDVDWEGEDVRDSLGGVVRMALEEGVRPVVEEGVKAALPFERAPEVFEPARWRGGDGGVGAGVLRGGSVVVRVAG